MSYTVVFTPEAEAQLIELYGYIAAKGSPEIAARFTDCIVPIVKEKSPKTPMLNSESVGVQEVLRRLRIYLSKLDKFKDFDTALARLAFREKRVCHPHARGDLSLRQARFFAGRDQLLQENIVESLMRRRPPLARYAGFRLLLFRHLSSVGNALTNPLIRGRLVSI